MRSHKYIASLILACALLSTAYGDAIYRSKGTEEPVRSITEDRKTYLSVVDLARATGCTLKWNPMLFEAQLVYGEHLLKTTMFSNYVRFDEQTMNMTYPAVYREGDLYVPAETFLKTLDYLIPATLFWDETSMTIRAEEALFNVVDIEFENKANGYLIEIILREKLPYEAYVTEQKWVNVNIIGGTLDDTYLSTLSRPRVIRRIRAFQFEESAQVAIKFYRTISKFHHSFTTNPPRIQIAIVDTTFNPDEIDTLASTEYDDTDPIDVVVIDPGHGGDEDGAMGSQGTSEKDITLGVSLKLRDLLAQHDDLEVIMTRDEDKTLTLQERADIANSKGGDLYVSIHCNSYWDEDISGSQTFFLAAAMNDEARATAMLENRSILLERDKMDFEPVDDLDFILLDLMQTEYLSESQELAKMIQTGLAEKLRIRSRGVDQAGFFVLNKVFMPSVLVEVAFLSNKREEALLKKDQFQQKAAEAIYEGIKKFIDKYSISN